MAMKFWGVEVKPGASVKCNPGEGKYIHLSQASLGKSKIKEKVAIYLKVDDNRLVIGSLSVDTYAQIQYDLVFEKEFELSHSSKNATISFCGYRTSPPGEEFDEDDSESEDEEIALNTSERKSVNNRDPVEPSNGKVKAAKCAGSADKQAKSANLDHSDVKDEDSDDDEDMVAALSDSDEEEESSDDEEEDATPKKSAPLKRPAESTSKTPAPEKKDKIVTPAGAKTGGEGKKNVREATPHPAKKTVAKTPANSEKSKQQTPKSGGSGGEGKKNVREATPHPAKKTVAKTPADSEKSKQQTPKSGGSVPCKSCTRTFNSESALQAHTKAKHA